METHVHDQYFSEFMIGYLSGFMVGLLVAVAVWLL